MRFEPHFLDEIRARLPVSQVVGSKVVLKKKGREFAGLSPFKTEKTPSFFVNDQKGFYHCFASGEHGDIFTFLIKTEGLSFPEAVERLATEAGVAMPVATQRDPEREDRRKRLYELMEAAAIYFCRQLVIASGREARTYLEGRQITEATIGEFRIGYAPDSRSALKEHLISKGFTPSEMAVTGMQIAGEEIRNPYDRFRHRIMFPICDAKGRIIAFGGRALSPDQPAKYLNSPETPLFHKGHILYNAHNARTPAFERGVIIAVEGYMDVVALTQAGHPNAVAPLGTALTTDQLQLLWRMAPEPTLCFDGDSAGQKAAYRAIDTVLPHLKAGYSLRFAFLPDGLDPDDLIRKHGSEALPAFLDKAEPLADVLWKREWQAGEWITPERRAALEARLREMILKIPDQPIRNHYGQVFKDRLWQAWRQQRAPTPGRQSAKQDQLDWRNPKTAPNPRYHNDKSKNKHRQSVRTDGLKQSLLVSGGEGSIPYREALLVRTLLHHPWLAEDFAEDIAEISFSSPTAERMKSTIQSLSVTENNLDNDTLHAQLEGLRLGADVILIERVATHKSDKFAELSADRAEVEAGWRHTLALHKWQMLRDQLRAAENEFHQSGDDEAMARIIEIQRLISSSEEIEASNES